MTDKIYEFDDIIQQPNTQRNEIDISNEIVQILITPDNKEYIVLYNYCSFFGTSSNLNLDNVKIYRDTFLRNELSNVQVELKIFPYLYGNDSEKILKRLQSCLDSTQQLDDSSIHLFYVPANSDIVIDPKIDSLQILSSNEVIIKCTLEHPGYLFIGKTEYHGSSCFI